MAVGKKMRCIITNRNQIVWDRIPITWKKITWIYKEFLFIIKNKIEQISHCAYQGKWPLLAGMKLHPSSEFHQLIDFQSIDHTFYAKLFLHYTTGLKAIKALLSSATFSPNGSVMHTEHWRFERGHCLSTMSWNPIWTRIIFDHAFIQLARKYKYWMSLLQKNYVRTQVH